MTRANFAALAARARHARVIDPKAAFMLAFDVKPAPVSPNFDWFQERYENFLYVDRIAVSRSARRLGHGATLYRDLFAFANAAGVDLVGCEVNADPPNPISDAFHAAQGFEVVGEAYLADRDKTVRYFARRIAHAG